MEDEKIKELGKHIEKIDVALGENIDKFKGLVDLINKLPPELRQKYLDKVTETLKKLADD